MKKYLLILPFLLFLQNSKAQSIRVSYDEKKVVSEEKLKNMPEYAKEKMLKINKTILLYKNGISIYKNEFNEKESETINTQTTENKIDSLDKIEIKTETIRITNKSNDQIYYKNINNNEMLFELLNLGKKYYVKDNIYDWKWVISDETKKIDNYNCKKATTTFLGYQYTAWFTEDIPVNCGPDRFHGLNGLIIHLKMPALEYIATKIEFKDDVEIIKPNFENKETYTFNGIVDLFTNIMKNYTPTKTTTQDGNTTITTEKIIIK
jgi:GLPGLI family protein